MKRQAVPIPNWDRLRTLINVGLKGIGVKPVESKLTDCNQGDFEMEIAHGYSVYWDGKLLTLQHATVIPGVRTFRNGDPGYPDSADVSDVAYFNPNQLDDLTRSICRHIAEFLIDAHLDGFFEEEMLAEQARAERTAR